MTRRVTKIMRDQPFGLNAIKEAGVLDSDEFSPDAPDQSDKSLVDGTTRPQPGTRLATIKGTPPSRPELSVDSLRSNSSLRTTPKSSPSRPRETPPTASPHLSTQNMNPAPRAKRVDRYVDKQAAHRARRVSLREELAD